MLTMRPRDRRVRIWRSQAHFAARSRIAGAARPSSADPPSNNKEIRHDHRCRLALHSLAARPLASAKAIRPIGGEPAPPAPARCRASSQKHAESGRSSARSLMERSLAPDLPRPAFCERAIFCTTASSPSFASNGCPAHHLPIFPQKTTCVAQRGESCLVVVVDRAIALRIGDGCTASGTTQIHENRLIALVKLVIGRRHANCQRCCRPGER